MLVGMPGPVYSTSNSNMRVFAFGGGGVGDRSRTCMWLVAAFGSIGLITRAVPTGLFGLDGSLEAVEAFEPEPEPTRCRCRDERCKEPCFEVSEPFLLKLDS